MRRLGLLLALAGSLAIGGCADYTYDLLGRGDWPHKDYGLYSRLGGHDGVGRMASGVVDSAAADPRLARYFVKADLPRFKAQLADRLCTATGGPCVYTGYGLADVHAPMVIDQPSFDAFLEDVRTTATANGVGDRDQARLLDILGSMRGEIVSVSR